MGEYLLPVVVFVPPNGARKDAVLAISQRLEAKCDAIRLAGFRFEGEYNSTLLTTTITGENMDLDIALSTDLTDRDGHRTKLERMIDDFDINHALAEDAEAA